MIYSVCAFYHFSPLSSLESMRDSLLAHCRSCEAVGIILLASEGINGTVACPPGSMPRLMEGIRAISGLPVEPKYSTAPSAPFKRMKVRLKKEIVTIGDTTVDPRAMVGTYVEAKDWNALIRDPNVLVVDTRNSFEYAFGTFVGAHNPETTSFGAFPDYVRDQLSKDKTRTIAMFCTGGIRCEKATSLLRREGFTDVRHLKGGILKYLEEVPEDQSLWEGGCFVFDERVALTHGLAVMDLARCHACSMPVDEEARASPLYEEGVTCPHCHATQTEAQKASARERQRQITKHKSTP